MKKLLLVLAFITSPVFAANQATLTWGYDMVAFPTATFNVYQAEKGQPKVKTQSGVSELTASVTTGLVTGKTYCWQVTAVVGTEESSVSNEACKTFPSSPTALTVN